MADKDYFFDNVIETLGIVKECSCALVLELDYLQNYVPNILSRDKILVAFQSGTRYNCRLLSIFPFKHFNTI